MAREAPTEREFLEGLRYEDKFPDPLSSTDGAGREEDAREGAHWKERATRCAIPGCARTRTKGWTTCNMFGHYDQGRRLDGKATPTTSGNQQV